MTTKLKHKRDRPVIVVYDLKTDFQDVNYRDWVNLLVEGMYSIYFKLFQHAIHTMAKANTTHYLLTS